MLNIKVLGSSGGIGGVELQTTSFLVGDSTLIDAGTGVAMLSLEQLVNINTLFLTHAHFDHIAACPMLVDSTASIRKKPFKIIALNETIAALNKHIFNWEIWPNFSEIAMNGVSAQELYPLEIGKSYPLPEGGHIIAGPADHQTPSCSYLVVGKHAKLFFSGDTTYTPSIVDFIKSHWPVKHIILECAFARKERKIAELAKHMYTDQVVKLIHEIGMEPQFYITHLKPSMRNLIMDEILTDQTDYKISRIFSNQFFPL